MQEGQVQNQSPDGVTSSRTTGLDGLAKQMVARSSDAPAELGSDFDHPDEAREDSWPQRSQDI